jgi:Ca2+-binding EF-hand superfamily protein
VNFADGDLPGPIDNLQDLEDTGKIVFKMADMDNNGLISQKEAVDLGNTAVGGFFFRADTNGDGKITKDEGDQLREELFRQRPWLRVVIQKANAQQKQNGQPGAREAIQGVLNLLDSNNDKALEASEVRQIVDSTVQGLYSTADTDRDGQMSPTEVNSAIVGITKAAGQALFAAADKDQNGQLSREEFFESLKDPANTVFAVLDANADDQLSQQEMDRAQRVIGSQLRALKVPEPANSAGNLLRTGRTPEQVAPVPDVQVPIPARDRAVQPAPAARPGLAPAPVAPTPRVAPTPGQPR